VAYDIFKELDSKIIEKNEKALNMKAGTEKCTAV
jgi:hypothetical protein